jgi:predicted permease
MLNGFSQDLRLGIRALAKNPAFTATVLLSLALGIGATTAVFSVIYGVIVNPYPYVAAQRMMRVLTEDKGGVPKNFFVSAWQLQKIQQLQSVESVLGQANWELSTTGGDLPEDVRAAFLTTNESSYFGLPALLGRGLLPSDAIEGQDPQPVVVLSFLFWKRHFEGRRDVVGRSLQLEHKSYAVVGVMPPRFAWSLADIYLPLNVTNDPKHPVWISSVRLRVGARRQVAEAEFQALLENLAKVTPERFPEAFRVRLEPMIKSSYGSVERTLYALFAAVAVLLLVGCVNVSILLLARGVSRHREMAVRTAVGATRSRIIRQLLTESMALALAGVSLGILFAYAALMIIVKWLPWSFPHEASIRINIPVLCFSVVLALLTGLIFGLWPALRLSRPEAARLTESSTRTVGGGARVQRMSALLVPAQIALTLLLLTAAGSSARSFLRLMHADLGYDPRNTLVVGIPLHDNTYMAWVKRVAYFDQLREKVAEIPGVISVAISTMATPPTSGLDEKVEIMGQTTFDEKQIRLHLVSPKYFSLLGIPLLYGRIWDQAETMRGARLAVINQTMARQYWPNGGSVGHSIRLPEIKSSPFRIAVPESDEWFEIIGVIADARNDGLVDPVQPAVYVPYTVWLEAYTHILVHTHASPLSFFRAIRVQIHTVDPDQQVERQAVSLEGLISDQQEWQQGQLATMLFSIFGLLGLALALIGLYSVVSYSVAQRTKEIGIRMALGAQRGDVLRSVFVPAAVSLGAGVAAGIALSLVLGKLLSRWTDVSSRDPLALAISSCILIVASALACLFPARCASGVDPMEALRCE